MIDTRVQSVTGLHLALAVSGPWHQPAGSPRFGYNDGSDPTKWLVTPPFNVNKVWEGQNFEALW